MLGLSEQWHRQPDCYRNYAAVDESGDLHAQMRSMEQRGLVEETCPIGPKMLRYRCTDRGRQAALERYEENLGTRAERRYRRYLQVSDVWPDLSFIEFLTSKQYADARADI